MAFTVLAHRVPSGDDLYYEMRFRNIVETHLNILKREAVAFTDVAPDKIYQYEGDFYGLLSEMGIEPQYHWIYLRVNDMTNPNQFGKAVRDPYRRAYTFGLLRPNPNGITELRTAYLATKN
jgi:hypothetical protein